MEPATARGQAKTLAERTRRPVTEPSPNGSPAPLPDAIFELLAPIVSAGATPVLTGIDIARLCVGAPLSDGATIAVLVPGAREPARNVTVCIDATTAVHVTVRAPDRTPAHGHAPRQAAGSDIPPAIWADLAASLSTAGAVGLDASGRVLDPFGGVADLRAGVLRSVLPPDRIVRSSPDGVLALATEVAQTGLEPVGELRRAAGRDAGNVLDADRGAWRRHLDALLVGRFADVALQFLLDVKVLPFLVPEVCAMVDFHLSSPVHHKDSWDHTKQVIVKAAPIPAVRWAALMHDTGKVWTRSVNKQGKVHFFRHEDLSAVLYEGVAGRFRIDDANRDRVSYIIRNHTRVNLYDKTWTDSAIRRLLRETEGHFDDLLAFSRADYTTKREWRAAEVRRGLDELERRIAEIRDEDARVPPLPKGFGTVLMERFAMRPGPQIGVIVRWLEERIGAGDIAPGQQAIAYCEFLVARRPDLVAT